MEKRFQYWELDESVPLIKQRQWASNSVTDALPVPRFFSAHYQIPLKDHENRKTRQAYEGQLRFSQSTKRYLSE